MMAQLHLIEAEHGRDRTQETRWGPRTVDLDLLCWPDQAGLSGNFTCHIPVSTCVALCYNLVRRRAASDTIRPDRHRGRLLERCTDTGSIERC